MPIIHDFIIVGLGTAGSATCMTLARRGFKVLGIDAHRPPHTRGSHHGASRSVRRAYMEGTAYVPMALKSWELWRRLEKDSAQQLLVKTGNLSIGPPDSPAVAGFLASAQAYTIPHECMRAAEVRKRWPQLAVPDTFVAGLEKEAGIVFPERCIKTFLSEAQKAGAELAFGERVGCWKEGSRSVHVHTEKNSYEAGRLLISAGAWSNRLLKLPDNTLQPKRVPVHWVEVPKDEGLQLGQFPVNFWQVPGAEHQGIALPFTEFYSLPALPQSSAIKVAFHNGLADCDPDNLVQEVSHGEQEKIKAVIAQYLPGLHGRPMRSEVCLYTMTPDDHFYLGKRADSLLVFGVALAGHGFKFAPVLGDILADLLTDVAPEVDIGLFSPDRFDH